MALSQISRKLGKSASLRLATADSTDKYKYKSMRLRDACVDQIQ